MRSNPSATESGALRARTLLPAARAAGCRGSRPATPAAGGRCGGGQVVAAAGGVPPGLAHAVAAAVGCGRELRAGERRRGGRARRLQAVVALRVVRRRRRRLRAARRPPADMAYPSCLASKAPLHQPFKLSTLRIPFFGFCSLPTLTHQPTSPPLLKISPHPRLAGASFLRRRPLDPPPPHPFLYRRGLPTWTQPDSLARALSTS